jgi:hypothetical protein
VILSVSPTSFSTVGGTAEETGGGGGCGGRCGELAFGVEGCSGGGGVGAVTAGVNFHQFLSWQRWRPVVN